MQVFGFPGALLRSRHLPLPDRSRAAHTRWQALAVWQKTGQWQAARDIFNVSRATLYRWRQQWETSGTLEARSRRPHRVRQPQTPPPVVRRLRELRTQYPRWGKAKLVVLLRREGVHLSASTVGRLLHRLKRSGQLVESRPLASRVARHRPRPWAQRLRHVPPARQPGDVIPVDTLQLRPLPGIRLYQCTARDVVSRWDVLEAFTTASATTATLFLTTLQRRCPFAIRALQVDGGSEFKAAFEAACHAHQLPLSVLPPRSPKLNGHVERANGTHRHEFYEVLEDCPWTVAALKARLRRWEHLYNHVRPHQALAYLTPAEFLTMTLP